jgi:lysozyme
MNQEISELTKVPKEIIVKALTVEEGLRLVVYKCTAGHPTIGIGHNLNAMPVDKIIGRSITKSKTITKEEAYKIFYYDLHKLLIDINREIPWFKDLDATLQYVLISMAFNMGIYGLLKFKNTLNAFRTGDKAGMLSGMAGSKWAKQVPNRAKRLMNMVKTGVIPD